MLEEWLLAAIASLCGYCAPFSTIHLLLILLMNIKNYRADIDGLRAIAVSAVIIFHLNPNWLSGGFIGVDIFFVISGFVITRQIRSEIYNNQFSIKNFYLRRIRRIAPPLLAMLLISTATALMILNPEDINSFAQSLLAQPFALQNIVFLSEGEYFVNGESKPLLHTWSLAVEEQFYLFWPLILVGLSTLKYRTLFLMLSLLFGSLFFLNVLVTESSPKTSFYLLPFRAWELGIGGLAAILKERSDFDDLLHVKIKSFFSWLGVAAIIWSLVFITSKTPFPGTIALIPTMGVFILLMTGSSEKTPLLLSPSKYLSHPLMVYIGLLSYSLYLWHWPILAYMVHLNIDKMSFVPFISAIALAALLSIVSYRFIESPIRAKTILATSGKLISAVAVVLILLVAVAINILSTNGASYRYNDKVRPYLMAPYDSQIGRCGALFRVTHPNTEICELTSNSTVKKKILLWGNSHGDMWSDMLLNLALDSNAGLFLNKTNCRATKDASDCNIETQGKILELIKSNKISDVILASSWLGHSEVYQNELFYLTESLSKIGVNIWLVVDIPVGADLDPIAAYKKDSTNPAPGSILLSDYHSNSYRNELKLYLKVQDNFKNVFIIDTVDSYCDQTRCYGGDEDGIWYRDSGHVSNTGAKRAALKFSSIFK